MSGAWVVPAYFHPAVASEQWRRMIEFAPLLKLVVVNIASGPGQVPEPAYTGVVEELRRAAVPIAGYLDTHYGRRSEHVVLSQAARYREWYGVHGVFLDHASADSTGLPSFRRLVMALRARETDLIAANPGVYPDRGYADLVDLLVTFEGPWREYRRLRVPDWAYDYPATRFCYLVYATPRRWRRRAVRRALLRNTDGIYVTDRGGPNPWDRLADPPWTYLGGLVRPRPSELAVPRRTVGG